MTAPLAAEPADRSFVVWFDGNGDPYAVFHRDDRNNAGNGRNNRWVLADLYEADSVTVFNWPSLCQEMDGLDGPHLLTTFRPAESRAVLVDCGRCEVPQDPSRLCTEIGRTDGGCPICGACRDCIVFVADCRNPVFDDMDDEEDGGEPS